MNNRLSVSGVRILVLTAKRTPREAGDRGEDPEHAGADERAGDGHDDPGRLVVTQRHDASADAPIRHVSHHQAGEDASVT